MKKILLILFSIAALSTKAQFVFEQQYDSASVWNFCSGNSSQLLYVNLEVSGERYIKINRCGQHIKLYTLGHVLVKTISIAGLPTNSGTYGSFLYFSEKLFNNDPKLEFMYTLTSTPNFTTVVYDENLVPLFSEPGAPLVIVNFQMQQYPIYNTSMGTKLILSYQAGHAKVFGLGGTLTTAIHRASGALADGSDFAVSAPMPNPVVNQAKLDYVLPDGVSEADVVIYDMQDKEVKRFRVDNTFDHILVSTSDVAAGTYFYRLQAQGKNSGSKKMVVVK